MKKEEGAWWERTKELVTDWRTAMVFWACIAALVLAGCATEPVLTKQQVDATATAVGMERGNINQAAVLAEIELRDLASYGEFARCSESLLVVDTPYQDGTQIGVQRGSAMMTERTTVVAIGPGGEQRWVDLSQIVLSGHQVDALQVGQTIILRNPNAVETEFVEATVLSQDVLVRAVEPQDSVFVLGVMYERGGMDQVIPAGGGNLGTGSNMPVGSTLWMAMNPNGSRTGRVFAIEATNVGRTDYGLIRAEAALGLEGMGTADRGGSGTPACRGNQPVAMVMRSDSTSALGMELIGFEDDSAQLAPLLWRTLVSQLVWERQVIVP